MITCLDTRVVLCASLGGEIGQVLEPLIASEGIELRVVRREATSGGYVHDRRAGRREEIADVAGRPLRRHELDEFYNFALGEGLRAPVSVLSGPRRAVPGSAGHLPATRRRPRHQQQPGGHRPLRSTPRRRPRKRRVLLKVSHEELVRDGRAGDGSEAALLRTLRQPHTARAESVVVSRAEQPALVLIDGEIFEVDMPRLRTADPRGTGDSMTAVERQGHVVVEEPR
jgi:1-phosphofructokinase